MKHKIFETCTVLEFKNSECKLRIYCGKCGKTFIIEVTDCTTTITCPYCNKKLKITMLIKPEIEEGDD